MLRAYKCKQGQTNFRKANRRHDVSTETYYIIYSYAHIRWQCISCCYSTRLATSTGLRMKYGMAPPSHGMPRRRMLEEHHLGYTNQPYSQGNETPAVK